MMVLCVCGNKHMEVREYTVVLVLPPCLTQELCVDCRFTTADHELPESSCLIFHLTARELQLQTYVDSGVQTQVLMTVNTLLP